MGTGTKVGVLVYFKNIFYSSLEYVFQLAIAFTKLSLDVILVSSFL